MRQTELSDSGHERIGSFVGLKAIALILVFMWHSKVPRPEMDIGARACEFLFLCSGFLVAWNGRHKYYRNIRFHLPLLTALKHRYSNRFNSR